VPLIHEAWQRDVYDFGVLLLELLTSKQLQNNHEELMLIRVSFDEHLIALFWILSTQSFSKQQFCLKGPVWCKNDSSLSRY
jgi:hypothetical protein